MTTGLPKTLRDLPTSEPRFIGKAVRRVEDPQLVAGRTEFIDNLTLPGMLHCAILRSPLAHARITGVDTREAEKQSGVVAVATGEDARRWTQPAPGVPDGWVVPCLALDKVHFVGEPVAAVAATSRYLAEDALEKIEVDYEPLTPVVDARLARAPDSPRVLEGKDSNIMLERVFRWGDVDAAFGDADHIVRESFRWNRLGANPIETFGVISEWDPVESAITCRGSYQSPSHMALGRAMAFGLPTHKVRLISHPHGGSFGGKGGARGTDITILLSRKAGGRHVKWIENPCGRTCRWRRGLLPGRCRLGSRSNCRDRSPGNQTGKARRPSCPRC